MKVLRSLSRARGFSLAVIVSFAIAAAVVGATFALVWHVLIRPLPYPDSERLLLVRGQYGVETVQTTFVAPPDFADRREAESFESAAAWMSSNVNLTEGTPEVLSAARVSESFFDVLGVRDRFLLGGPAADLRSVTLSESLWRERFGARADVVGAAVRINGVSYTVAGVAPRRFAFPEAGTDLWIPLELTPEDFSDERRGNEYLEMIARLRPGVSIETAEAEMDVITAAVVEKVPGRKPFLVETQWRIDLESLHEVTTGEHRKAILLLFGGALLVMLLVAANVTGLTIARTISRQKELAVRRALGAGRGRISGALLLELELLAVTGAAAGLLVAQMVVPRLAASGLPRAEEIGLGAAVVAIVMAVSVVVAGAIGAVVAAYAWRSSLLQQGTRSGSATRPASRLRAALVCAQVAIAVTLLATCALLVESYRRIREVDPGFRSDHVMTFRVALPVSAYPEPQARRAFFDELQRRIEGLPGVVAASAISNLPLSGDDWTGTFHREGFADFPGSPLPAAHWRIIQPGYDQVLQIPLLSGRMFDGRDYDGAARVVVIDERTAERYWPGEDAVGKRISLRDPRDRPEWREVVGVVGSVRHQTLQTPAEPHLYLPASQTRFDQLYGIVRTSGDPAALAEGVRSAVRSIDPLQPVFDAGTMRSYVDRSVEQPKHRATILTTFAAISLLEALLGLYALLTYVVLARTREVGVRMALGARGAEVVRMFLRWGLSITSAGIALGIAGAIAVTRSMRTLLYGVEGVEVPALAAVAAAFLLTAILASAPPIWRAARTDPAEALRSD